MNSPIRYVAPLGRCGYLPDQTWQLVYEQVDGLTPRDYMKRMLLGWRRFGSMMFQPQCPSCQRCQPLRIPVDQFEPDRSQRRVRKQNQGIIELRRGEPSVTREKLDLYDRYHAYQTDAKGWPEHGSRDPMEYAASFVDNPFPTQEWCYYLNNELIGVGYVDDLPGGLSAIYFFYDPDYRVCSLGTWNVLSILEYAAERGIPHVYLGFFVEGCRSMAYKARFRPNEVRGPDGEWRTMMG